MVLTTGLVHTRKPKRRSPMRAKSIQTIVPVFRQAFTLIEVLVVVAIIALLISILMPSLGRARASARSTQCLSNERQFGVAITAYAVSNKDWVPRGSNQFEINWTMLVVKMLGDRKPYASCNEVPVGKQGVFQCPERVMSMPAPFVDYVVNALDFDRVTRPAGQEGQWIEAKMSNLGRLRQPTETIFLADAEYEEKNIEGLGPSLVACRKNYESGLADANGIDAMDIWLGEHLPEGKVATNVNDNPSTRRVARKMHLGRFTNAVFFDAHAASVPLAPKEWTDVDRYGYWLKRFGVRNTEQVKAMPMR